MADDMTQEQMLEMQRQNCVFCKIIRGEMQSLKVYEDDKFLAVLDIRPAASGHVLLMPKEHVLFLPLLPEGLMTPMFEIAAKLSSAIKDAMIAERMTVFIASGTAAEQPPPPLMHLVMHLIPREKGDGLDALDITALDKEQSDSIALSSMFAQATKQALMHKKRDDLLKVHHLHKKGAGKDKEDEKEGQEDGAIGVSAVPAESTDQMVDRGLSGKTHDIETRNRPSPVPTDYSESTENGSDSNIEGIPEDAVAEPGSVPKTLEFGDNQEALASVLEMYPDLRRLIIAQPDLVSDYVKRSPQLARLFEGVNIHALGLMLSRKDQLAQKISQQPRSDSEGVVRNKSIGESSASRPAVDMTGLELMKFIDGNQGLRQWLLNHPEELATRINENERLKIFFKGVDILSVSRKYREHFLKNSNHGDQGGGE